jgi:two-component system response regulator (stage 0 sporulation protein A)
MIKVLVVDDDESFLNDISNHFNNDNGILIMGLAKDGNEAIKYLSNEIDIIILDLIMPNKDGYSVVKYIKDNNLKTKIVIISSSIISNMISMLGIRIDYFFLKPINYDDLKKVLIEINEKNIIENNNSLIYRITKVLCDLGMPKNLNGFNYVRYAIMNLYYCDDNSFSINSLYDITASKFNTTKENVERCIRHAIDISWVRGDLDLMDEIFGSSVDINKAKPTNSEYIYAICDRLKIENVE